MNSIEEILDFAIAREQEAVDFYIGLAKRTTKGWMRDQLLEYSEEEKGHKAKLTAVKTGQHQLAAEQQVSSLNIADYTVAVIPNDDMNMQDALIVAMQREKAAYRLYTDLAAKVDDAQLRELFLGLAQEEAKHKLYFEVQYDERVLQDN